MHRARLLQHFEALADTPGAVEKLRSLVLDLAVHGRLVEQHSDEAPARQLLKCIQANGDEILRKQGIKPVRTLPEIENVPFNIPLNWTWTALGNVGQIFNGNSVSDSEKIELAKVTHGLPFIATKDVGYGRAEFAYENGLKVPFNAEGYKVAHKHAVLICAEGGSAGKKMGQADRDICFGNKLYANEVWAGINPRYVLTVYQSPAFYREFLARMTGIIGGIARSEFLGLPIPVPPEEEQHRIVERVEELLALCDELEARQTAAREHRAALVRSAFDHLTAATTPADFRRRAAFVLQEFPNLTATPEDLSPLRQSILQLAIQGRLLPQAIGENRSRLGSDGEPFSVPSSWHWESVSTVGQTQTGSTPPTAESDHYGGKIPFIKPAAISEARGEVVYTGEGLTTSGANESTLVEAGTVLMVCIGGSIGKAALVDRPVCFNQQINSITPRRDVDSAYVLLAMRSPFFRSCVLDAAAQGTLPIISKGKWERLQIPLPPLAEQKRIVAKVEELMRMCDDLEAQLAAAETAGAGLLDAAISQILNAAA